ncbi:MAG: TetR/AcrR family transcriptional regulator, partial [Flammeovirgaceae bacterium]
MAKENDKLAKRERIKAAALELFAQHDYHATSTEMIITNAGVSKGLLFFYFKNKQELLETIRNEWMENLWAAILPIKDEALKPIGYFEVLLDNILQTLIE